METVFHKILSGELPNYTVFENEHVLAFLSIAQSSKGHTLVIPKVFARTLADLPNEALAPYMQGIQETMKVISSTLAPDGFNVGWNIEPAGGQSVMYLHCHIIPRYTGDGDGNMHTIVDVPSEEVAAVAALFE